MTRRLTVALVLMCIGLAPVRGAADPIEDLVRRGWTDADLTDVPAMIREDVEVTLRSPSLIRHFARIRVRSDLQTEGWLADHPPIAAAIARELKVLPFVVTESWPGTYKLEGGTLSRGSLNILLRTDTRAIVFASARIRSPWRSPVRVYAVICIRWWPTDDRAAVEHDIFMYGRLRSRTARWIAFVTRPFSGPLLTRRLHGMVQAGRKTAEAVSADPEGWAARMGALPDRGLADQIAWEELLTRGEAE